MKHFSSFTAVMLIAAVSAHAAVHAQNAPDSSAASDTLQRVVRLPEVVVSTARAGERTPVARTTLERKDVLERNWGQDTPMALATTPSAYAYSDAGNGIGYSYLSIRGFPQRRISVLVDGVPLNDPESHEVYWIDHPDLLASSSEVQVQRGVGSALYGAASLGGSVNIETMPFTSTPAGAACVAYGSYDTKRYMVEGSSGALAHGLDFYGRYSRIETLGYRDQSFSKLWSYALAARKQTGAHTLRLNLFGGPEETHLAYLGVPRTTLEGGLTGDADKDRRFNPITYANERDHFFEPHYELIHTWALNPNAALTHTLFWFDGKGYYDEQRFGHALTDYRLTPWYTADTTAYPPEYFARDENGNYIVDAQGRRLLASADIVRRRTVENRHYGWVPRLRWEHGGGALTVGGELRAHDGRHWGEVLSGSGLPPGTPPNHAYYDYHPRTLSAGLYAREEWNARPNLLVTADLGWRHQDYKMRGDQFDGVQFDQSYDFALPRLGVTWTPSSTWIAFASWSYSAREPAFRDLYDAEGAGSVPLYAYRDPVNNVYRDPLIVPEKVNDYEAGATWRRGASRVTANVFFMDFRDELVYAGQFNTDLGYPVLGNAAQSVHQGVELEGETWLGAAPSSSAGGANPAVRLRGNAVFGDHYFVEYREQYGPTPADEVIYDGNAIGFFPATLANATADLNWRGLSVGAGARYVGRIYLDNTETKSVSIEPHTIMDASAGFTRAVGAQGTRVGLNVRVFNVLDEKYETGGYLDFDASGALVPVFIPAATRNVLAELRINW